MSLNTAQQDECNHDSPTMIIYILSSLFPFFFFLYLFIYLISCHRHRRNPADTFWLKFSGISRDGSDIPVMACWCLRHCFPLSLFDFKSFVCKHQSTTGSTSTMAMATTMQQQYHHSTTTTATMTMTSDDWGLETHMRLEQWVFFFWLLFFLVY
jgi:hypothetical protein